MDILEQRLSIPYIKIKFSVVFPEDAVLPRDKVSALRGGMGEMLLRQNCISDRDCGNCDYRGACIVHKTVYTKMERKPAFMQGADSVGYLIECENYRTDFRAGEGMFFYLVLFGDNIVYFGQYLQAFYQLGAAGIGKYSVKYVIRDIRNMDGDFILKDNQVFMKNYRPETVLDYVIRRRHQLGGVSREGRLVFHTPLCLKYRGEYIQEFHAEAILQAVFRRIMMMDYFVRTYIEMPEKLDYPLITRQSVRMRTVRRYSSTQDATIALKGIEGNLRLDGVNEEYIPYLLAGELLHIGKNTSFGFGRYTYFLDF